MTEANQAVVKKMSVAGASKRPDRSIDQVVAEGKAAREAEYIAEPGGRGEARVHRR